MARWLLFSHRVMKKNGSGLLHMVATVSLGRMVLGLMERGLNAQVLRLHLLLQLLSKCIEKSERRRCLGQERQT